MGHERVGILPRTKPWREIVAQISATAQGNVPVAILADMTLEHVRDRFARLKNDTATQRVFAGLVDIAVACQSSDDSRLRTLVGGAESPTPLVLARWLQQQAELDRGGAPEYGAIAATAAGGALAEWYENSRPAQVSLFGSLRSPFETWRVLATGSGFCEMSRLFFAKSTELYLNYFLQRAASEVAPDIRSRERFQENLSLHVAETSKHAFETAKITQSFAAGWFNKHARDSTPDSETIRGFVSFAFEKMREALAEGAEGG